MLALPPRLNPLDSSLSACLHLVYASVSPAYKLASCRSFSIRYFTHNSCSSRPFAYDLLLQRCASSRDLHQGMLIHNHIIANDIEQTEFLENNMLHMYVQCGALVEAQKLFQDTQPSSRFSWNVMIRSYIQSGESQQALDLFVRMDKQGIVPDTYIFVSILSSACVDIVNGMKLHANIVRIGIESHVIVATTLVNMYGKCGHVNDALILFQTMPEQNVISWNSIIAAHAKCGQVQLAWKLYTAMQEEGFLPDRVTFVNILCACAQHLFLRDGRQLHAIISFKGVNKDVVVYTALIDMYGKCGRPVEAHDIFLNMDERNTVSWTALISAYAQDGDVRQSSQLYKQMHQEGILADKVTFLSLFDAFACESALVKGKRVHASIAGSSFEADIAVATSLLNMYGKCGDLEWSRRMFDMLLEPNEYSWNSMVASYVHNGRIHEPLHLFGQMNEIGCTPHELAIVNVLYTCGHQGAEEEGVRLHSYIIMNSLESEIVLTALVDMYSKFRSPSDAQHVFDLLYERTVAVWNALIAVQSSSGNWQHACQSFEQVQQEGLGPDRDTFVNMISVLPQATSHPAGKQLIARINFCGFMRAALVNLYGKCSNLRDAYSVFRILPFQDLFVWNAIILAAIENAHIMDAFQLFSQMYEEGVIADKVIFLKFLDICANNCLLMRGKLLHVYSIMCGAQFGFSLGTALISMYGRCGNIDDAQKVFNELPDRNLFTWTCMITICAQHGQGNYAILLFHKMWEEGFAPDKVTYTSVLSACGHSGGVDDGKYHLLNMNNLHGIIPVADHFNCTIDLLGKACQFDEAENLIVNMPFQPTVMSWTIALDAYIRLPNVDHGSHFPHQMLELDDQDPTAYVTFSNVAHNYFLNADSVFHGN